VHFVGIGGVGMSGIAEVLCNLGYSVSGSDKADNATTRRLAGLGARIDRGHDASNVADADVLVVSSAIHADNAELLAARERRIPVVPRAEMLGELMRFRRGIAVAGTHGKTTTTSLTASVLAEAGLDPTFVIGGQLIAAGANARLGTGDYLVAEADESDGSFLLLSPVIAIVTNIDADHLENYDGDFERVKKAFADFLHRLPFYGVAVLCVDDAEVAALARATNRRVLTYAIDDAAHGIIADVRASNLRQHAAATAFTLHLPNGSPSVEVTLNLPGRHNVLNALAACAVGWQLGVPAEAMQQALAKFQGVGRRFQLRGEIALDDGHALLVDDYGHHPRELAAVFAAARAGWPERRLVVGFQPHRYSRTRDLLDDFANVLAETDVLVLTDVYPAGEAPIANADGRALARAVRARGKVDPVLIDHPRDLHDALIPLLVDGDLLLLLGAGDIGAAANEIAQAGHLKSRGAA
jgi:UDP-N-acetylmuramate--alanine ligase